MSEIVIPAPDGYRLFLLLTFEHYNPAALTEAQRDDITLALSGLSVDAVSVLRAMSRIGGPAVGERMLTNEGQRVLKREGFDIVRLEQESARIGSEMVAAGTLHELS